MSLTTSARLRLIRERLSEQFDYLSFTLSEDKDNSVLSFILSNLGVVIKDIECYLDSHQ